MAVVVFDPILFYQAFPEFSNVPENRLIILFGLAEGLLDNTDCSPVQDIEQRTLLFYLIVAHLLTLLGTTQVDGSGNPLPGSGPSGTIGRTSSATEGTVSVSFSYKEATSTGEAWWQQTQYGAMYWMMTARWRSFRYIAIGRSGAGHAVDFRSRWRDSLVLLGVNDSWTAP